MSDSPPVPNFAQRVLELGNTRETCTPEAGVFAHLVDLRGVDWDDELLDGSVYSADHFIHFAGAIIFRYQLDDGRGIRYEGDFYTPSGQEALEYEWQQLKEG